MPFYDFKSNVDHSTLYSIGKPFQLLHADIADTRFLAKSVIDPKYCLLLVDLFTSKIYIYPMKRRNLLARKLKLFYEDVKNKRTGKMHLQTDLEFKKNRLLSLTMNLILTCFTLVYGVEKLSLRSKKRREFKKLLLRGKRFEKQYGQRL